METDASHRAGFVNILGNPNVGKSTLVNSLVGERLAIITNKPQTTRKRMLGIVNTPGYQIVFSDTPGKVDDPQYELHRAMNRSIKIAMEDADLILLVSSMDEEAEDAQKFVEELASATQPVFLVVNKVDLADRETVDARISSLQALCKFDQTFRVSALTGGGVAELFEAVKNAIPEHPPYFPKEQLTDLPERFFVSEIIREKILEQFHQEVPYSCEVTIESFKEEEIAKGPITRIRATIYVARKSQKAILIGKGGSAIKRLGTEARKSIEAFLGTHVFLDLHVKVRENWRDNESLLKNFGYN